MKDLQLTVDRVCDLLNGCDKLLRNERDTLQAELAAATKAYNELIYAVGMKHQGESRHQTALRYIREHENRNSGGPAMESHHEK